MTQLIFFLLHFPSLKYGIGNIDRLSVFDIEIWLETRSMRNVIFKHVRCRAMFICHVVLSVEYWNDQSYGTASIICTENVEISIAFGNSICKKYVSSKNDGCMRLVKDVIFRRIIYVRWVLYYYTS